mgnify:CR=1 FL=1
MRATPPFTSLVFSDHGAVGVAGELAQPALAGGHALAVLRRRRRSHRPD